MHFPSSRRMPGSSGFNDMDTGMRRHDGLIRGSLGVFRWFMAVLLFALQGFVQDLQPFLVTGFSPGANLRQAAVTAQTNIMFIETAVADTG